MNTMNPDQLDDQIRTMMQTAVERTDAPPTVDDVVAGLRGATVGHPGDGGRRRGVAIAAALLLVIAGGVGWWVQGSRRPSVTPANQPTGDPRLGVGAYALPSVLPAGWALVDISEMAADNVGVVSPRLWVLRRADTGQRAVLAVYPPASDDTDATMDRATETTSAGTTGTASGPAWFHDLYTETGELRWTANGVDVFLAVSEPDETQARALHDDLQPSTGSAPLTYTLSKASPYVFEKSLGEVVPSSRGWANLTYADGVGNTIHISLYQSSAQSLPTLLNPDIVSEPAAVRAGENAGETFGYSVVESQLEVAAYSIQRGVEPVDTAALQVLLDSMDLVDEQQWDDEITAFADRIAAQPATSTGGVAGGTLSLHRGAEISGICFTVGGDRGCRPIDDGLLDSPPSQDVSDGVVASILVGDRWVFVRGLTPSGPTGPIEIESMIGSGDIEHGAVAIDEGTFAVLNSPLGIDAVVFSVGPPDGRVVAEERIIRPIR